MNRGRNTAILAVLAVALGAYLFFVERHREPAPAVAPDGPRGKAVSYTHLTLPTILRV